MVKKKRIPKFENEDAEREFWASHDSSDYIDWPTAKTVVMPNLKPTLKTIPHTTHPYTRWSRTHKFWFSAPVF